MRSRWVPWLSRLAFSFFIIFGLLVWESYKAINGKLGRVSGGRIALYLLGALASFVLAIAGIRERHRAQPPDERDEVP